MNARERSRAHLAKACEFLESAETNLTAHRWNAAAADAVVCGINAKDAICLSLTGTTRKSDNHAAALAELRAAGRTGADVEPTLRRLLNLKTRAQYQTDTITHQQAQRAVEWAGCLCVAARSVVVD